MQTIKRIIYTRYFSHEIFQLSEAARHYRKQQFSPRNVLLEIIHAGIVDWFIEQEIPLSVELNEDPMRMELRADVIATLTWQQDDLWREKKIIDKLSKPFNNKNEEDYPF